MNVFPIITQVRPNCVEYFVRTHEYYDDTSMIGNG